MWWFGGVAWADDATAWLVQDRASREEGVVVEIDGFEVDATLPIEIDGDVGIAVTRDEHLRQGWVRPGFVYVVEGRTGRVRAARPDLDVATGAVHLATDADTARELAAAVGAELRADGDGWLLVAPGLLGELARTAVPEAELDLRLVAPAAVPAAAPTASSAVAPAEGPRLRTRHALRARLRGARVGGDGPGTVVGRPGTHGGVGAVVPPGVPDPGQVGWYFLPDGWMALGADGWAHWCPTSPGTPAAPPEGEPPDAGPPCVEAGRWASAAGGGFVVGEDRFGWRGAALVREVTP